MKLVVYGKKNNETCSIWEKIMKKLVVYGKKLVVYGKKNLYKSLK